MSSHTCWLVKSQNESQAYPPMMTAVASPPIAALRAGTPKANSKPIIPMIVDVKNSWKFKNWHTFYISKPFSKMRVVFEEPLYFNKNESTETGTQKIEHALKKVDKVASDHE